MDSLHFDLIARGARSEHALTEGCAREAGLDPGGNYLPWNGNGESLCSEAPPIAHMPPARLTSPILI